MKLPIIRVLLIMFTLPLTLPLTLALPTHAQTPPAAAGTVAFVGVNADGDANIYILNIASGQIGQVLIPVTSDADLAWHPNGNLLVFTTTDGGYGLLRSLRGCFEGAMICADTLELLPQFHVEQLEWLPGGESLVFRTDEGLKIGPPRARPDQFNDFGLECSVGLAIADDPYAIFCANEDAVGNVDTRIYAPGEPNFIELFNLGTYPEITAYDIGTDAQAVVGTLESAGDSGFYGTPSSAPQRLANYQVHIYDLALQPDSTLIAIAGAISDSTGDSTLHDGDAAELHLFDTVTGQLTSVPGFTGITAVTWSPDGEYVLAVLENSRFRLYANLTQQTLPVNAQLPAGLQIANPAWNPGEAPLPPISATATPIPTLTQIPVPTRFPTFTPWPTFTPIPTITPGSPLGTGCEFAYAAGPAVAVGDTAEVTQRGTAVRFRTGPAATASMITELAAGTRMTVLDGPYCAQGYRWWQVQVISTGRVGYLADSDTGGYWIQRVDVPPTLPAETISFYADRYTITAGECVTIRWDVEGIQAVYYENLGVTGHDSRLECPATTRTYSLRIVRQDNSELTQTVTITVNAVY